MMIKKIVIGALIFIMSITLISCGKKSYIENVSFSENILFTINNGSAGWGTIYDCMDADITIYCDRTIRVDMLMNDGSGNKEEVAVLEMTENDYDTLLEIVDRNEIYKMDVTENLDVCDGSSSHIILYDENDAILVVKGGYMPEGDGFGELYSKIKEVLNSYGINEIVDNYRKYLEESEQ